MSDEEKKKATASKAAKKAAKKAVKKKAAKKAVKKKAASKTASKAKAPAKTATKAPAKKASKKAAKKTSTSKKKSSGAKAETPAMKAPKKKATKKAAASTDDPSSTKSSKVAKDGQPPPQDAPAPATKEDRREERSERDPEPKERREQREQRSGDQDRKSEDSRQGQQRRGDGRDRRGGEREQRHDGGGRGRNRFGKNGRNRGNRGKNRNRGNRGDRDHRERDRPTEIPTGPPEDGEGLLEISNKGFGFLRQRHRNFTPAQTDIFVTPEMVRNFGLRDGLWLDGIVRQGSRGPQLTEIKKINGKDPSNYKNLPIFEELKAVNPTKRLLLETTSSKATTRVIDMMTPIGRGQRGLIVAPPRTGKTTILHDMAEAVLKNHEGIHLIILLIDERPEEVTEFVRSFPQAEVMASSNDSEVKAHIRMAELAIERAKRLVEAGEHVFILLDSITRLARASNRAVKGGGRAMSGGIDARALEMPRRLFAAARNTRDAGSLTIVATALIETNNRGDDLIFQEFKGTGNMEVVLDRQISQQYIYPSVDIFRSGTRREELLLPAHQLEKIYLIRRGLAGHKPVEAIQRLLYFIEKFPNNAQMLLEIKPDR